MNQLQHEQSPYLLQHKDNPIHWWAWGEPAFETARREQKPIFLSVGYSTCHWCHVMAHESFEDVEVAEALNKDFISIKVDREERPDVDDVYMTALQSISGGGGWPMSIWLMPDGKPFFAGTYFPKQRFLQLLGRIMEIWKSDQDKLLVDSERLMTTVQQTFLNEPTEVNEVEYEKFLQGYIGHFEEHFDPHHGGFGGAPKFPQTMNLMVMMRQDYNTGQRRAETIVNTTLLNMVRGGVYDQLNGGFHRYSVDEQWLVPHFEKMLYDQALLTVTLVEAYQLYGQPELKRAACETLDYVIREMTHPQGGFYSAQDADSLNPEKGHSEEGYFCTYAFDELDKNLSALELAELTRVYGVSVHGNFEGRNILHLQHGVDGTEKSNPVVRAALEKLKTLRASKPQPHLDDKVIVAWNGWMIWALTKAGLAFGETRYLEAARQAMGFVQSHLWHAGKLQHFWRAGQAKGAATAEDYASMIHACLELYQADFDGRWAEWALMLQKLLDAEYRDIEDGTYFTNDGRDGLLPLRPKDDYDGVSPCSNSMAALNLHRFYLLTGEGRFKQQAEAITSALFGRLKQYPSGLPFLALAIDLQVVGGQVAIMQGSDWVTEFRRAQLNKFMPHVFWSRAESGWPVTRGKTGTDPALYICEDGQCHAPLTSLNEAQNWHP